VCFFDNWGEMIADDHDPVIIIFPHPLHHHPHDLPVECLDRLYLFLAAAVV
jgi:methylglyoxal synthase